MIKQGLQEDCLDEISRFARHEIQTSLDEIKALQLW